MKQYIILCLKRSKPDEAVFWRSNAAGHTSIPWAAGIYAEDEVKGNPEYYNNGYDTIAIPLTDDGIEQSGLRFTLDEKALKAFVSANRYREAHQTVDQG